MLINNRLEAPFNKLPKEGPLPIISKVLIKSQLTPKFWEITKYIYEPANNNNNQKTNRASSVKIPKKKKTIDNQFYNKNTYGIPSYKRAKTPITSGSRAKFTNFGNNKIYNYNFDINKNNNCKRKIDNFYQLGNKSKRPNKPNKPKKNNIRGIDTNDDKELKMLKKTILNLEDKLNKREMIITKQKEEKIQLLKKINELEKMYQTIASINKF